MKSNNDINKIIKKYNKTYVDGECTSTQYSTKTKQEKRLNEKLDLADTLFNEIKFPFTKPQKKQVKTLIHTFPNFKELHSKASNEEILLAFIFYVKALDDKKNKISSIEGQKTIRALIPKIDKQLLFPKTFEIISWNITKHYITKQPILPTQPENIDHNILYKG